MKKNLGTDPGLERYPVSNPEFVPESMRQILGLYLSIPDLICLFFRFNCLFCVDMKKPSSSLSSAKSESVSIPVISLAFGEGSSLQITNHLNSGDLKILSVKDRHYKLLITSILMISQNPSVKDY